VVLPFVTKKPPIGRFSYVFYRMGCSGGNDDFLSDFTVDPFSPHFQFQLPIRQN
jgi:hypothetical protein